ncbi:glycerophosphoryl diester phosphodiesterase membrane domain-containing protein [Sphingomonas hengshuiensis]|nr:glycerophosphoryl diester phosphodiesterase membrane domain-containing protein [Sphingomonas hengshuiensis]
MGTVWDRTAEFLSDNIGMVLPVALLAFFVPASIEGNFEAAMAGGSIALTAVLRGLQLAFAVLSLWGTLTLTAMALDLSGETTAGRIGAQRLVPAIVVSLVLLAAAVVLALPVLGILVAGGVDLTAMASGAIPEVDGQTAGIASLYLLVLFVAMLWIGARLIVTTPAIVRENRWLSAIRQSWRLTRGSTLRIVGVILLYALVSWVAQLAANTVFGSIFALVAGGDGQGVTLAGVLTSIVTAAVQTAFMVILPAFEAKLYLALTAQAGLRSTDSLA